MAGSGIIGCGNDGYGLAALPILQRTAAGYPAVAWSHPTAPALTVLGGYLRNRFLHTAIREKGGAYGGGAGFDADSAAFRFYSYRDPRLADTLADFDRALAWLHEADHPPQAVEEAILGVIAAIDTLAGTSANNVSVIDIQCGRYQRQPANWTGRAIRDQA